MVKNLSILQAYCVVLDYLDKYYFKTYSNDIGDLVGDMHFLQDGRPVDDAAWEDWLDAVSKKGKPEVNVHQSAGISLTIDEAYAAMINFLEGYVYRTNSEETRKLLDEKIAFKDGKPIDAGVFDINGKLQRMNNIEGADAFAVTLEPKGGSVGPTMDQLYLVGGV